MRTYYRESRPRRVLYRDEPAANPTKPPASILKNKTKGKTIRWDDDIDYRHKQQDNLNSANAKAAMKKAEADQILQMARRNLEMAVKRAEGAKAAQRKVEQTALIYVTPVGNMPHAHKYMKERNDERRDWRNEYRSSSDSREDCNTSVASSADVFSFSNVNSCNSGSRVMYDDCGKPIVVDPASTATQLVDDDSYSLYSCNSIGSKSSQRSTSSSTSSIARRLKQQFPKVRKKASRDESSVCSNRSTSESIADSLAESIAESISTSISQVSASKIPGVMESQPLGGPKYYIATITKKGQAKVIHEAMPGMMDDGSSLRDVAEERGYEIMEYHMCPKIEEEQELTSTVAGCSTGLGSQLSNAVRWKDDESVQSNNTSGTGATGLTGDSGFGSRLNSLLRWRDDESVRSNYTSGTVATGLTGDSGGTGTSEETDVTGLFMGTSYETDVTGLTGVSGFTATSGMTDVTGLTEATTNSSQPKGMFGNCGRNNVLGAGALATMGGCAGVVVTILLL